MNPVQTKCLWGSAAAHGLLTLLLVAGSGFLASRQPVESMALLTMVPDRLVDEALAGGGGDPKGGEQAPAPIALAPPAPEPQSAPEPQPAPVQPPEPAPEPQVKPRQPEPVPEPAPPKPKPVPEEPAPKPARATVPQSKPKEPAPPKKPAAKKEPITLDDSALRPMVRTASKETAERTQAAARAAAEARDRRAADARRQLFAGVANNLQGRLSSGGVSAVPFGPGGESYANYSQFVFTLFDRAWRAPEEVSDDSATVRARVVIARDGKVISATIVGPSGISVLDKSVKAALDRVDSIGKPFPEGANEQQRTFLIKFNLKARRAQL